MIIVKAGSRQNVNVVDIHPLQSSSFLDEIEWNSFSDSWDSLDMQWQNIYTDTTSIDGSEFTKEEVIDPILVDNEIDITVRLAGIRLSSNLTLWSQADFQWNDRQVSESFVSTVTSPVTFSIRV